MLKGIDVAKWQGEINWPKVKQDFAILKITDKSNQLEAAFERNYAGCYNNHIRIGGYRYVYAKTITAAEIEAQSLIVALKGKKLECGIWLDMEDSSIKKLGKDKLSKIIDAEAKLLEANGYNVGIYCNRDWFLNVLDGKKLSEKYPFWIARYPASDKGQFNANSTLNPKAYAKCWQYSQCGKVDGIKGNVDLDVAFESFDEIFKRKPAAVNAYYYPAYKGKATSIVDALAAVGEKDTSYSHRKTIAKANGILKYQGSMIENNTLLNLLKAGRLIKA